MLCDECLEALHSLFSVLNGDGPLRNVLLEETVKIEDLIRNIFNMRGTIKEKLAIDLNPVKRLYRSKSSFSPFNDVYEAVFGSKKMDDNEKRILLAYLPSEECGIRQGNQQSEIHTTGAFNELSRSNG